VQKAVVESARPLKQPPKTLLRGIFKAHDVIEDRVSPELVAGIKITVDDERQFDGSLRAKLDAMFGND
jgi:F0F1-type ATP synthase delta subunit